MLFRSQVQQAHRFPEALVGTLLRNTIDRCGAAPCVERARDAMVLRSRGGRPLILPSCNSNRLCHSCLCLVGKHGLRLSRVIRRMLQHCSPVSLCWHQILTSMPPLATEITGSRARLHLRLLYLTKSSLTLSRAALAPRHRVSGSALRGLASCTAVHLNRSAARQHAGATSSVALKTGHVLWLSQLLNCVV